MSPAPSGRSTAAREGGAADIVDLLDRPVIRDPSFRGAVAAIHAGDVATLERLLDAEPRLRRERIREPACYRESGRRQYFLDPKLVWFVAFNPVPPAPVPDTIVDVTRALLARGVEQEDLDYTLELLMSGAAARQQRPALMEALLDAGARATSQGIAMTLAHGELEPVDALLRGGLALTAPIAAALGRTGELPDLLAGDDVQLAFGLAVINARTEAA